MSRTIKTSSTVGIRLSEPGNNPVTVAAGVSIASKGGFGLYGIGPTRWVIQNLGTVSGASQGIHLLAGGQIGNGTAQDTTASISGGAEGVWIAGAAGTVVNDASIDGYRYTHTGTGTAFTALRSGTGVELDQGGLVSNGASYVGAAIFGGAYGVLAKGASATVLNAGAIVGEGSRTDSYASNAHELLVTADGDGVALLAGGTVMNASTGGSAATIKGGDVGVAIAGGVGLVTNDGTVLADVKSEGKYATHYFYFGSGIGVSLAQGGAVDNAAGANIEGGLSGVLIAGRTGTVVNAGAISGMGAYRYYGGSFYPRQRYLGTGVDLSSGGTVTNTNSAASIVGGRYGVSVSGGRAKVMNDGLIRALGTLVGAPGPTTPVNARAASLAASLPDGATSVAGIAVLLADGGSVTNATVRAMIDGGAAGVAVAGAAGTVVNHGTISAMGTLFENYPTTSSGTAIAMSAGGSVTNGGSDSFAARKASWSMMARSPARRARPSRSQAPAWSATARVASVRRALRDIASESRSAAVSAW